MLRPKFFFSSKHRSNCETMASILLAKELTIGEMLSDEPAPDTMPGNDIQAKIIRYSKRMRKRRCLAIIEKQKAWYEEELDQWAFLMLKSEIEQRQYLIERLGVLGTKYFGK